MTRDGDEMIRLGGNNILKCAQRYITIYGSHVKHINTPRYLSDAYLNLLICVEKRFERDVFVFLKQWVESQVTYLCKHKDEIFCKCMRGCLFSHSSIQWGREKVWIILIIKSHYLPAQETVRRQSNSPVNLPLGMKSNLAKMWTWMHTRMHMHADA